MIECLKVVRYDCGYAKLSIHPDVPANLGWQLMRILVTTSPGCMNVVATQNSYSPDDGSALLEEALEEEVLEDANLVDVEVKAEQ
ncbi:hypothetical protein LR48_Vigan04g004500 [Vigna angularis]|uniref:Uncharacterized protein n=1 Tax=Phaseolus angularis TaxID=3914 RepID=A0A0L9UBA8_PHAAN|nr:hypothetical protein LR48_Vigan04g004500 [Vigna angularis]